MYILALPCSGPTDRVSRSAQPHELDEVAFPAVEARGAGLAPGLGKDDLPAVPRETIAAGEFGLEVWLPGRSQLEAGRLAGRVEAVLVGGGRGACRHTGPGERLQLVLLDLPERCR